MTHYPLLVPSVYLIVSGETESLAVYAAFVDPKAAIEAVPEIEATSQKPCRILPIVLADKQLAGILEDIASAAFARNQIEASKLFSSPSLWERARELEQRLSNYLLSRFVNEIEVKPDEQR